MGDITRGGDVNSGWETSLGGTSLGVEMSIGDGRH